ncbi:MAG: hypothetical protein Q9163_002332 [Psora crenata]
MDNYTDELTRPSDGTLSLQTTPQKPNVLSNKIANVLSASYADSEIRDALQTLDDRKVQNTVETRRGLRLDAQKDVIQRNGDIVKDFGQVAEQLMRIRTTIKGLSKCCEDMRRHVAGAHQENAPVLDEASTLLGQKKELETEGQLLQAFNKHFVVSEEELSVLTSTASPADDTFFAVLARLKQIHGDCQILLGSENQRLGLELMDHSWRALNGGYQKLYKWIQFEFNNLNLENPQISSFIRRALRALAERPTLFQSCLDFLAEAREHVLTDAFYLALTGSSVENDQHLMTKPIEFYSHDPVRYVSDMLAWTHSAAVSEREALETLFKSEVDDIKRGFEVGREAEPWAAPEGEAFDGEKALSDLVNRTLTGVASVLRQRIDQVLHNHDDALLLYRISNVVAFYTITFSKLLSPESGLLTTLSALTESALLQFRATTSETIASIQSDLGVPSPDLRIPDFLDQALNQLSLLMKSYDSSLTPVAARQSGFEPVITQALDPFLTACEKMTREMSEPETSIFLANCLLAARSTLASYDFVQSRSAELDAQLQTIAETLIDYQHVYFLHTSGLHPLLLASMPLSDSPDDILKIATLPPFQPQALTDASQTLDDFLPSALMDAMENLKRLSSTKLTRQVTAEAADRFCETFEFVEGRLIAFDELRGGINGGDEEGVKAREGGENIIPLRSLFPRTSGEIRVLLS